MDSEQLQQHITQLLASQRLAVLSTSEHGRPYASLIAFYFSPDLRFVYFATSRATRKYANLMTEPQVALLIDSRSNQEEDFHRAAAATILGKAVELDKNSKKEAGGLFLARHPYLREFIEAPTTALFSVQTERYIYVSRFQEVFEYRIANAPHTDA